MIADFNKFARLYERKTIKHSKLQALSLHRSVHAESKGRFSD